MTQLQQKITLPAAMSDKLNAVRLRTLRVRIGTALVATVAVLLTAMALAMCVDWLTTLYDIRWRAALTYTAWATAGLTLVAWAVAAWRHTRNVEQIATKVDLEIPELEERWATVTSLSTNGRSQAVHPAMLKQVTTEAQSWTPRIEPDRVVPLNGLIRALLCLTAITSVLGLAVLFGSDRTTVLLRRFWQPHTEISATELIDVTEQKVVGRGEAFAIAVNLAGAPVDSALLMLEPAAGEAKTITLTPRGEENSQLMHRLRSVKEPMRYRLRAGDGQTPWYEITVADRPALAEVRMRLTPPAYTRKEPKVINKLPRRVTVLEGSQVSISLKPKQPLRSLQLKLGADENEQLTADDQGWYHWETTLTKNLTLQPLLTEEHGLDNLRPPLCEIKCRPDRPPVVKILTPNNQMSVRPDETVPVTFVASDDVGVHHAELVVYDESQKIDGKPRILDTIPVPLGDQQGAVKVKASVDLDLSQYKTADGSELSFAIRVREERGQATQATLANSADVSNPQMRSQQPPGNEQNPQANNSPSNVASSNTASTTPTIPNAATPSASAPDTTATASSTNETPNTVANTAPESPEKNMPQAAGLPAAPQVAASDAAPDPLDPLDSEDPLASEKNVASSDTPKGTSPKENAKTASTSSDSTMTKLSAEQDSKSSTPSVGAGNSKENKAALAETSVKNVETKNPDGGTPRVTESAKMQATGNPKSAAANTSSGKASPSLASPSNSASSNNQSPGKQEPNKQSPQQKTAGEAPFGSKLAMPSSPDNKKPQPNTDSANSPSPPNPLSRRGLDVQPAQASSSQRMKLKIDQWAGSFDGQQRQKLEVSLAPRLEALDRALEKAQLLSRSVLDAADAELVWASKHGRDIQQADKQVVAAIGIIEDLERETYDTPYAFIGLQLVDIDQAHISPARRDFWKSLQTEGLDRIQSVRSGWQNVVRARELMVMLTERFERTKLEYKMAASVQRIKKMYRVFSENSLALLQPQGEGGRYSRKMAEFELDEEYLKRLQEVLNMRSEMRAELARILADDPRLLRRFLDVQKNRTNELRDELSRLIEGQYELNRESQAWASVEEADRSQLTKILLGRHLEGAQDIARAASNLADRFEAWSPLGKEVADADFTSTAEVLLAMTIATRELSNDSLQYITTSRKVGKVTDDSEKTAEDETSPVSDSDLEKALGQIAEDAQNLYERFTQLEVLLRQIGSRQENPADVLFATNRLLETRRLIEQTSAWIRQLKQQQAGNYHRSAEVAQYRLAMATDTLAGKLSDLEQRLAGVLNNGENTLPEVVAQKARGLLANLDEQAAPNQLAAVYALRRNKLPRATTRQKSAYKALEAAGQLYDDMIEALIIELDKLPVQDPIAGLLNDPTLDELLQELEQETPIEESLGIPRRPSNLQIMQDWLRGNDGNAVAQQLLVDQMRQREAMRQRQLDNAYRRAVARALKDAEAENLVKELPPLATELADWNRLASDLDKDIRQGRDKAPPERYRSAIEQYFRHVSDSQQDSE